MDPHEHVISKYGKRALQGFNGAISRWSVWPEATFYDPARFPWVREIEAEWRTIRAELDEVLREHDRIPPFHEVSSDQYDMSHDGKWKTFFFYGYGNRIEENCRRCPETTRLLSRIPGMTTAFFSILAPGKHIPPHEGPYKGVLRYHLGLKVPDPPGSCRIRVGNDVRAWSEGGSLVFDDSYTHEAWNDSAGERVVLFVDFVRPMRFPGAALNAVFLRAIRISPFVTRARKNIRRWQERHPG